MKKTKIYETRTLEGLRLAEKAKMRLENKYNKVKVIPIGFDKIYFEYGDWAREIVLIFFWARAPLTL